MTPTSEEELQIGQTLLLVCERSCSFAYSAGKLQILLLADALIPDKG